MIIKDEFLTAYIGDLVLKSHCGMDRPHFSLDATAIQGWYDGVSARRDSTPHLISAGDFYEPGTLSSRLVTFTGTAVARTPDELNSMRDMFVSSIMPDTFTEIHVDSLMGPRYFTVSLEGKPEWIRLTDTIATYSLQVYAPDPRMYSEERRYTIGKLSTDGGLAFPLTYPINFNGQSDNMVTIQNSGNVRAWPSFVVTGNYPSGFTLFDNVDSRVTYTGIVTTVAPVTIDMRKGTATQNKIDKTTLITNRDWFGIDPGQSLRPELFTSSGTGWCDIIYRDTFI